MKRPTRKPPLDLIAIGDSTLDVFLHISEATVSCQLHKPQCLLCFDYAEKIPVDAVTKVPGAGNASNAAIGGSRLGMKTALVSIVGNDSVANEMRAEWRKEGVRPEYLQVDKKQASNYSTVLNFQGERTILVYHFPRHYRLPKLATSAWVYYTSIGPGHETLEQELLAHLKKHPDTKLAFNPGTHQMHRGLASLKPVIARSDLFIVNKEEARRLLEDGERPIPNMLMAFHHLGAKQVVITDGPEGSFATNGTNIWKLGIFRGPLIERTGAGDSYTIGMVYALFAGMTLPEAMRVGTANAWNVVQHIGPQAGLLTKSSLAAALKKFARQKPILEARQA
jgi:sugar/nucleoside kinase (ribokinase family)